MIASGRIVSVQEQRFRFATDQGQVYLLTLDRHAPLDAATLAELHGRAVHLTVSFSGEPNLSGGVAHNLCEEAR